MLDDLLFFEFDGWRITFMGFLGTQRFYAAVTDKSSQFALVLLVLQGFPFLFEVQASTCGSNYDPAWGRQPCHCSTDEWHG